MGRGVIKSFFFHHTQSILVSQEKLLHNTHIFIQNYTSAINMLYKNIEWLKLVLNSKIRFYKNFFTKFLQLFFSVSKKKCAVLFLKSHFFLTVYSTECFFYSLNKYLYICIMVVLVWSLNILGILVVILILTRIKFVGNFKIYIFSVVHISYVFAYIQSRHNELSQSKDIS